MIEKIKKDSRNLFVKISDLGIELNMSVYVVGGYVRDLFLGNDGFDIDFVVIGDALKFCKALKKRIKAGSLVTFPRFGTCMLQYKNHKLEFVTARTEIYQKESRKPVITKADLLSDLSRRDFTINTMAMDIHPDRFGQITDPYNGRKDLKLYFLGYYHTPVHILAVIFFLLSLIFYMYKIKKTNALLTTSFIITSKDEKTQKTLDKCIIKLYT